MPFTSEPACCCQQWANGSFHHGWGPGSGPDNGLADCPPLHPSIQLPSFTELRFMRCRCGRDLEIEIYDGGQAGTFSVRVIADLAEAVAKGKKRLQEELAWEEAWREKHSWVEEGQDPHPVVFCNRAQRLLTVCYPFSASQRNSVAIPAGGSQEVLVYFGGTSGEALISVQETGGRECIAWNSSEMWVYEDIPHPPGRTQ